MMYNKLVKDCFFSPQHVGAIDIIDRQTIHFRMHRPKQRVIIDFYLSCAADEFVARACFKTNGNPYVIAALEWLCRQVEHKNLCSLPELTQKTWMDLLELPVSQSPVAVQMDVLYKEVLIFMKSKLRGINHD